MTHQMKLRKTKTKNRNLTVTTAVTHQRAVRKKTSPQNRTPCDIRSSESDESHHHCPHGWSQFRDHCYLFVSTPKAWVDAEVYCQFDGANLASVHCEQGNHFLMSLTRGDTHNFPQSWLGGFDSIRPGFWMWSDGSDFDYNNWAENVHDDKDNNCLRMNYEYDLKWFPTSCRDPLPFVCAKSLSAPPDAPRNQE
ncbi:ladderlectin-like [Betta splendens]|uniref:Ladderlectin-like n=1 Tax=Betta splendens TaxID=158456 RepID=A0A9W2Y809_BETSP|nr:ladderlectin-like [Betta splendens]